MCIGDDVCVDGSLLLYMSEYVKNTIRTRVNAAKRKSRRRREICRVCHLRMNRKKQTNKKATRSRCESERERKKIKRDLEYGGYVTPELNTWNFKFKQ